MTGGIILYLYGKTPKSVVAPQSDNVGAGWEEENVVKSSGTSVRAICWLSCGLRFRRLPQQRRKSTQEHQTMGVKQSTLGVLLVGSPTKAPGHFPTTRLVTPGWDHYCYHGAWPTIRLSARVIVSEKRSKSARMNDPKVKTVLLLDGMDWGIRRTAKRYDTGCDSSSRLHQFDDDRPG
jgi:hypothetical protein